MNKSELITAMTADNDLSKGDRGQLTGFGSFEVKERAGRMGRNPRTGAEVKIPAFKAPVFKPGKSLKDAVQ